jgi:chromosome segregation ATPase
MADVISFESAPLVKLRQELNAREAEIRTLRAELTEAKTKISSLVSVNEMLKLNLADLANTLTIFTQQMTGMITNVNTLRSRLPTINSRLSGVRTQDRPPADPDDPAGPA